MRKVAAVICVLCVVSLYAKDKARIVGIEIGEEISTPLGDVMTMLGEKLETWVTYYSESPAYLTWATPERATYFDMADFPNVQYPFYIKRVKNIFYEHPDYPWDNDQFTFKIYADDGSTLLYQSANLTAQRYPAETEFDLAGDSVEITSGGFWVSVRTVSATGYPSCLADGTYQGHSFYGSAGAWTAWDYGELARYAYLSWASLEHDVCVASIYAPPCGVYVDTSYAVACQAQNVGTSSETFDVQCLIKDTGDHTVFADTQGVLNLSPGASQRVDFDDWTPLLYDEVYEVSFATLLGRDMNTHNDTLMRSSTSFEEGEIAYDEFLADGWWVVNSPNGASDCFATKFTPYYELPFYVTKGKVYVNDTEPAFEYIGLFPSSGNAPDISNPYQTIANPSATVAPGWIVVDFDTSLTQIEETGDLWLVVKFLEGGSGPGVASDETPPLSLRSYWTSDMTSWNLVDDGDWLMRIVHMCKPVYWDASVLSIDAPDQFVEPGIPVSPQATVTNYGDSTATFNVMCYIERAKDPVYADTALVSELATDAQEQVTFDEWTPGVAGEVYTLSVFTALDNDEIPGNDTLSMGVQSGMPGGDYLIWDPDPDHISGPVIHDILGGLKLDGDYTTTLTSYIAYLPNYSSVFVCCGQYPNTYVIGTGSDEAAALESYLTSGGNMYLEGGDVWYYDPTQGGYDFNPFFGSNATGDGTGSISSLAGVAGSMCEDMSFDYDTDLSQYSDIFGTGDATLVFTNQGGEYVAHCYTNSYDGHTFGFSGEIAGIIDGTSPNTKTELVSRIMAHLLTGIEEIPMDIRFSAVVMPNPARGSVSINYSIPKKSKVSISVYDISGRQIRSETSEMSPGNHTFKWNGTDNEGRRVASGVYFYKIEAGKHGKVGKITLLR